MSTDIRRRVLRRVTDVGRENRMGDRYLPQELSTELRCGRQDIWEALWSLTADGLIYLWPDSRYQGWETWRWYPSSLGRRSVNGGPWEPDDSEGYLLRLREEVPQLDELALRYVEEALGAFNARCYLASSVMLGVASEQAFNGLASAFLASLPQSTSTERLRSLLDDPGRTYYKRWGEFRKRLEPIRENLPEGLGDNLLLDAVGDLLRITRNSAGHPTGRDIDENTARTHLQIAATYLGRMTSLRIFFVTQSQGTGAGESTSVG